MPRPVGIEIFNTARTAVDRERVRAWLDHIGADKFEIPPKEAVTDSALNIALAAKRCYMSFQPGLNPNVWKIREDMAEYIENILKSKHGSVLEHSFYTFAIEGVSRVFTAEMNRHRAGVAISEGSLRFIRFDKQIPYWVPTSLQGHPDDDEDLKKRKTASRLVFFDAFEHQEKMYAQLLSIWDMEEGSKNFSYKKKVTSCLRRIVGMGVASGGLWTVNMRAVRHIISMRADSTTAEEEIYYVWCRIARYMIQHETMLFGDFREDEKGSYVPDYWKV
jgi:thymidylate synthase (FAD)